MWTHITHMQKYWCGPRCINRNWAQGGESEKSRSETETELSSCSLYVYSVHVYMKAYIMLIICPGLSVCTLCKVLSCLYVVSACSVLSYQMLESLHECHPDKLLLLHCPRYIKSSSPFLFLPFLLYLSPSGQHIKIC